MITGLRGTTSTQETPGSVVGLLDAGEPDATPEPVPARLVERYDYDPYGKTYIAHWDPAAGSGSGDWVRHEPDEPSAFGNPFMWTGQRHDVAIGLYHFPFRTYSPRLGRWLQRDPLGYVDGVNLVEYVRSMVNRFVDPLGFESGAPSNWPIPPGHGDGWVWRPNKTPPSERSPEADPGHWQSPDGRRWRFHPEDKRHNDHWDVRPPKGSQGKEQIPVDPDKPAIKPKPNGESEQEPNGESEQGPDEDQKHVPSPSSEPSKKNDTVDTVVKVGVGTLMIAGLLIAGDCILGGPTGEGIIPAAALLGIGGAVAVSADEGSDSPTDADAAAQPQDGKANTGPKDGGGC